MPRVQRLLAATAIATAVLLGAAAPTVATHFGPDPHASCVGTLTTNNTHHPEGLTRADIAHLVKAGSDTLGLPPGAFYSFVADLHLGSVVACLEALPD